MASPGQLLVLALLALVLVGSPVSALAQEEGAAETPPSETSPIETAPVTSVPSAPSGEPPNPLQLVQSEVVNTLDNMLGPLPLLNCSVTSIGFLPIMQCSTD